MRIRTADLRITNALLYQLSYIGDTYGILPLRHAKVKHRNARKRQNPAALSAQPVRVLAAYGAAPACR